MLAGLMGVGANRLGVDAMDLVCPTCHGAQVTGVEYARDHPQHYDGVSEWQCDQCGTRWGRWSRRILAPQETEPRYGGPR